MLEITTRLYEFKGQEEFPDSKAFGPALHENIVIQIKSDGFGWIKGGIRLKSHVRVSKIDLERLSTQSGYRKMPSSKKRFWLWAVTKRAKWFYKTLEIDIVVNEATTLIHVTSFSLRTFKIERKSIAINPKGIVLNPVSEDVVFESFISSGKWGKCIIRDQKLPSSQSIGLLGQNIVLKKIKPPVLSTLEHTNISEIMPSDRTSAHEKFNLNPTHYEQLGLF